jgi:hypothetical protein
MLTIFYFWNTYIYKMNNYTDQPPRKLFGLALIEYKKSLKLTCEQKNFGRNTIRDASIACKRKPVCVKFEQKPLVKNIFIVYS